MRNENNVTIKVEDFADWATIELEKAALYFGHGSQDAGDEANWIASFIAKFSHQDFENGWDNLLLAEQIQQGKSLVSKRIQSRKPLSYLINEAWFAGYRFYIDERALIPRSHLGEWIPEKFEPWCQADKIHKVLDLCCGGGSIGLATALYLPHAQVDLLDLSSDALQVALHNINHYALQERVKTIHSDLFEKVDSRYDLILCNPPYVSNANMQKLPQEYRYEPEMALVAGDTGLDLILDILNQLPNYLTDEGALILEAGSAAPALDNALKDVALTWLMSASGESVVLYITREEVVENKATIQAALTSLKNNSLSELL